MLSPWQSLTKEKKPIGCLPMGIKSWLIFFLLLDAKTVSFTNMEGALSGCTHISQSKPCLNTFDPESPVCLTSVSALYGTLCRAWQGWKKRASAQYEFTCMSTGTECRHRCDCLWRIHLKFRQTTAYKVRLKSSKICHCLFYCWYQRTIGQCHYKMKENKKPKRFIRPI